MECKNSKKNRSVMVTLPSATLGKAAFAKRNAKNTRQSWKNEANFGQFPSFAKCRGSRHSAKNFFKKKIFAESSAVGHSAQKFSKKKLFSLRVPGW
jgi:hypothetical protein